MYHSNYYVCGIIRDELIQNLEFPARLKSGRNRHLEASVTLPRQLIIVDHAEHNTLFSPAEDEYLMTYGNLVLN
jgi:hypothetical protein